nr:iron chelate uptake ABC transporter family permease subunit [Brachybacterium timonense]
MAEPTTDTGTVRVARRGEEADARLGTVRRTPPLPAGEASRPGRRQALELLNAQDAPPAVRATLGGGMPCESGSPACINCPAGPGARCTSGAFSTKQGYRRYRIVMTVLVLAAVVFALGHLAWDNPMPLGTRGFWLIAELRATSLIAMAVVAIAQAMATISFQTVTSNRIITPSIMGFESLYVAIQTSVIYFLGAAGITVLVGTGQFILQILAMVGLSLLLYGWLLSGKYANLQVMLLVGIILGGGLGSVSTFMQRLLTPSEFDILTARMFGSISKADADYFPIALPLVALACLGLWLNARRLNIMALGRETCINLGIDHKHQTIIMLVLVSVLMAVSTALVGPMTFFGFLVATLTYQLIGTHDHRRLFPAAALLGFVVLCGAYFVMNNVFYAQGVVSIIIELVGGSLFLFVILRKGRLQ